MKKSLLIISLLVSVMVNAQDAETNAVVETEVQEENIIVSENITNEMELVIVTNEDGTIVTNEVIAATPVEKADNTGKSLYVEAVGYTVTNGDQLFASPKARFEMEGIDEQSGLKEILVSVDGSSYSTYKNPISFSTEGGHSLNYRFLDRVGNESYSETFSVTIDATAPRVLELDVVPAIYQAAGIQYVGPNSEISFRAHDDLTGLAFIEYATNDQEMIRFETNTTFAQLGYTNTMAVRLSYQATDMVSNVSPVKSQVFVVDATGPEVDIFAKAIEIDGVRYISSKDKITVEAFDNDTEVVQILYSVNSGEFVLYDTQVGIFLKESGEYTISAKAVDAVGNESQVVEYQVSVDMLAPTGNAVYIGEVRSEEYDPLATEEVTEESTEVSITDTDTELAESTVSSEEVTETTEESEVIESDTTAVSEVPAGTEVDVMQTETTE